VGLEKWREKREVDHVTTALGGRKPAFLRAEETDGQE
jgi:hypothetical protein